MTPLLHTDSKLNNTKSLGARLSAIDCLITEEYEHIWDCCCDHGMLGMTLLARNAAPHIHFVDVTPEIMEQLESKLKTHFTNCPNVTGRWRTYCQDASNIEISKLIGKQLIVVAGVGGDLTRTIVETLINNLSRIAPDYDVDFLLCPVRQQYALRESLNALGCKLKKEVLVEENSRIYEVMLVTHLGQHSDNHGNSLSLVCETGDEIWRPVNAQQKNLAKRYLDVIIKHYSRVSASGSNDGIKKLRAYQSIKIG